MSTETDFSTTYARGPAILGHAPSALMRRPRRRGDGHKFGTPHARITLAQQVKRAVQGLERLRFWFWD